ncbi:hypothetical protein ONZ51_g6042 [Trametes cubensis]|uniref:BCAS3 WD40 domain-containing protein n=1 Tax=Trametes cubensis TaxID=1111947 RepID=A0AAD7XD26_9APHY|nr:hypothetical protein ONZ51_g6042 [Trametes cubensis]
MPSRNKRNAPSRRQQLSAQASYSQSQTPDLLSFEPDTVHNPTTYDSQTPAVFELEAPPSDPELGRESTVIRNSRNTESLLADPVDYLQDRYSIAHNAISQPPSGTGRTDLSKLAIVEDSTSDDSSLTRSVGHIRSPVLARSPRSHNHSDREPTTLESFSRTIRHYVPSSIPIPTAAPSPPRVSRPVSFGSFLTPSTAPSDPVRDRTDSNDMPDTWKRRGSDAATADPRGRLPWASQQAFRSPDKDQDMPVFNLDDDVSEYGPQEADRRTTRYPGVGDTEEVLWAGWDVLADGEYAKPRSILMLGYPTGLQLWDCSNLGAVAELLNLSGPQWGAVEFAGVLPDPPPQARGDKDPFQQKRPLIAFSSRTVNGTTDFLVYSLRSHEVVKKLPLIGFTSFAASAQFITLSSSNPPTLHVLSSCTLATLYTIPSTSLVPFAYPTSSGSSYSQPFTATKPNIHDVVSPIDIDVSHAPRAHHAPPHPIYALSNRLLAYVAPISRHPSGTAQAVTSLGTGHAHTSTPVPAPEATNPLKLGLAGMGKGMTQADLGTAAVKIGGSVLSGMKTLGGLAMSAARAGVSAAAGERDQSTAGHGQRGGSGGSRTVQSQRRRSLRMSPPADSALDFPPPPTSPVLPSSGCNIIVIDLQPLLSSSSRRGKRVDGKTEPEPVAQFTFSRPQALSSLKFSADGTTLAVCSKEGHTVRVLQLRPTPRILRQPVEPLALSESEPTNTEGRRASTSTAVSSALTEPDEHLAESTQHVYTLRRGRTSAVVEGMEWAHDKLWFGMSTRKRTIHVFAVDPLGGKPDGSSHVSGKVANSQELVSTSTELSPLVRVRLRPLQGDAPNVPCAFTFVRASDIILPSSLLPPATIHFSASSSPSSVQSGSGLSKPVSPAQRPARPTNYKDLLVFDPTDGTLTLRRIFVERSASSSGDGQVVGSIPIPGGMSISLPGMSTLSRSMGTSPQSTNSGLGVSPRKVSALTQMMERGTDIVGKESVVGTWTLARGRDWPEVKQVVKPAKLRGEASGRVAKSDWLSRAELSTFSASPRILPRLIYLSHQFAFHVLGEDYHALIRSAHLDVPSTKIEVRKPVEVSAFATGDSEAFVQGLSSSHVHGIGGVPSSFDEPLASALSAPLHPLNPSPPVLPMLPNGVPGSSSASRSFIKHAIPIRHVAAGISDGMSEGLGRIRRELGRSRAAQSQSQSPRLNSGSDPVAVPSVPLEFDEEDEMEDFARHAVDPAETDAYTEADVISRSTSMGDAVHEGASAGSGASVSVSTPSTNIEPLPEEHDGEQVWQGWGPEDQQAVEDAERFDDITVGFLDEEQETMRAASVVAAASAAAEADAKKGRKRRGARKH